MSWLQLSPEETLERTRSGGGEIRIPSFAMSVWRGMEGFTVVSVAGFVPWAVFGRWFHRMGGELGMYLACMAVFIGLSGLCLHRLILGPGSLGRFYKLFSVAFAAYSAGWIAGWMLLGGHRGSVAGLLAGTMAMGWILAVAFDVRGMVWAMVAVLFAFNGAGYFGGGWVEGAVMGMPQVSIAGMILDRPSQGMLAMLSWGVCYGIGFGAGLGITFHIAQERTREVLRSAILQT